MALGRDAEVCSSLRSRCRPIRLLEPFDHRDWIVEDLRAFEIETTREWLRDSPALAPSGRFGDGRPIFTAGFAEVCWWLFHEFLGNYRVPEPTLTSYG